MVNSEYFKSKVNKVKKFKGISVSKLQGDSKKTQEFSLIIRTAVAYELCHGITNPFFLLKTEIHMQILNTEPFLCLFRGLRYLTNKMGLWSKKIIFILPTVAVAASEKPQDTLTDLGEAPEWPW